ncbi:tetratricopeptide repeat protein [Clostridium pasteurianum]|uniref:Uncharacterized protein n=1 Tax=Clostridium pasteurianum BC1 TaxID=86416 RepID=R4KF61_CLOPA|nr:hypothetical protein [Clostridium pasteurianum]AGK99179.1 hypothetical protein Clopa_4469 [Clostridium pasteurianum BC1]
MYKKIPFKIRVVILGVFCIFAIIILIYNAKFNYTNHKAANYIRNENNNTQSNTTIKANENKLAQDKKKEELNAKRKKLDDLCEQGYNDFGAKQYSQAINKESQVLAEDPNNYRAHAVKGIALCYLGSGTYDEGMQEIDKSLQIEPNYGYGTFNKALALELYGHYDEALTWYNKDLQIENRVWSYYGKAAVYGREGDVANTVANLKIAISMQSNIKDVARNEEDFANVRNSPEFQQIIK